MRPSPIASRCSGLSGRFAGHEVSGGTGPRRRVRFARHHLTRSEVDRERRHRSCGAVPLTPASRWPTASTTGGLSRATTPGSGRRRPTIGPSSSSRRTGCDVTAPAGLAHPRSAARRSSSCRRFGDESTARSGSRPGWQYIQNAADSMLDATPPDEDYARAATGQHGNYSTVAPWYHRHLEQRGVRRRSSPATRSSAAKGVEMLMTACAYERWLGPLFDDPKHFDPPWHSALETAMMTTAVATGYDLLYPHLTDEQRADRSPGPGRQGHPPAGQRLGRPGQPRRDCRGTSCPPATGSWSARPRPGVGALAILGEEPEAAEWVRAGPQPRAGLAARSRRRLVRRQPLVRRIGPRPFR